MFTIKVTALVAQNSGEEITVVIELSDENHTETQKNTILTAHYLELDLRKGEIDREKYEEIIKAREICSAYKKGLSHLQNGRRYWL